MEGKDSRPLPERLVKLAVGVLVLQPIPLLLQFDLKLFADKGGEAAIKQELLSVFPFVLPWHIDFSCSDSGAANDSVNAAAAENR